HDADISREEIIARGLVPEDEYNKIEEYALRLFERGQEVAKAHGLILVDTKYEFGNHNGTIMLMDEVHTPDSSRYFYLDTYEELFRQGLPQRQLSKEFVREWLMENGFQGKQGQQVPLMTDEIVAGISERYIELYEQITGEAFPKSDAAQSSSELEARIENNIVAALEKL
ncbi:MAG: phosphoribosylaminoimidazolesuccinocarboxamide synthase, partial [Alistipes sp.]|nr:phosphoribosylaminoimidazolesuccinocarboxamide synthase [Alistipes sp.]